MTSSAVAVVLPLDYLSNYSSVHLSVRGSLSPRQVILTDSSSATLNQIYVPELDRIVLGDKRGTRSFLNVKVGLQFRVSHP